MRNGDLVHNLRGLDQAIRSASFSMAQHCGEIFEWWLEKQPRPHVPVLRDAYRYLSRVDARGVKPNFEQRLAIQFTRAHKEYETAIAKAGLMRQEARIQCAFPNGGIYDSTITRLLLMSSSEHHVQNVPMALYFDAKHQNHQTR